MVRKIEFLVGGIVEGKPGVLRLIGRNCEDDIKIGDCFVSVYDYEDTVDSDGHELARRIGPSTVHLQVIGLEAYGHQLQALGMGMTGAIELDGAGKELVHPGLVLGGEFFAANGQPQPDDAKSTSSS